MRLALLLALLTFAAPAARGQYFSYGQNRVQYERLRWEHVASDRLDVYFYERDETAPSGRVLADFASRVGEGALDDVARLFGRPLGRRVPLLVYQSHNDFAVTNAVDLPVGAEGIGGVTEMLKNRVAVPFTGDWGEFRRVLRHEIVHAVLNDLLYGGSLQAALRGNLGFRLPDWFDEGLAEYVSFGWDAQSDLALRDAVLEGYLPPVRRLSGYLAYRGGQGFWDFLAAEYGREKVGEILDHLVNARSVDAAFVAATGLDLSELSARWHDALREVYFPEAAAREPIDVVARLVASGADDPGRLYAAPAVSPQGDRVAWVAAAPGRAAVLVAPTAGTGPITTVLDGAGRADTERLRLLSPGLAWDPSGRRLAAAVTRGPGDALAVVDVVTGAMQEIEVPGVDAIIALAWSPDSTRLALEATAGASSDIYLLELVSRRLTNLTNDVYSDHSPAWSPDSRHLAFYSDRGAAVGSGRPTPADVHAGAVDMVAHVEGAGRQFDLYLVSTDDPETVVRLTDSFWNETSPAWAGANRLLFVSDFNGVPNLHVLDPGADAPAQRALTDLRAGIVHLSASTDGGVVATLSIDDGAPAVYVARAPIDRDDAPAAPAPTVWARRTGRVRGEAPALALAPPGTVRRNPLLRAAAEGRAPASEFRRPVDSALVDSLLATLGTPAAPDSDAAPARPAPDAEEPRRYRLSFAPDLVTASGGYDTVFGVQAATQVLFTDLLGDHRFRFASNLVLDLRNADYLLAYEARGGRVDYAVQGFHLARELVDDTAGTVYRYRNFGFVGGIRIPLDTFRRLDFDVAVLGVALADLSDLGARARIRRFISPRAVYTVDRTRPGWAGPGEGWRWAAQLSGTPGPSVNFVSALADGRRYVPIGPARPWPAATLAVRASGGISIGPDPQRFYAAGVTAWLNPTYRSLPVQSADDFVFAVPVLPVRGFGYNEAAGDRFAMLNLEVRAPLAAQLFPGALPVLLLRGLQAVAFVDAGVIASGGVEVWRDIDDGAGGTRRVLDDVLLGTGVGLRTVVLGYPVRADWAWPFEGERFGEARFYVSVGADF